MAERGVFFAGKVRLDHKTRMATFRVQHGLLLPVEVQVPFAVLKKVTTEILDYKVRQEMQPSTADPSLPAGGAPAASTKES